MVDNNYRALALALPYVEQDRKQLEDRLASLESMTLCDWKANDNVDYICIEIIEKNKKNKKNKQEKYFTICKTHKKHAKDDYIVYAKDHFEFGEIIFICLEVGYAIIKTSVPKGHEMQDYIITRERASDLVAYIDKRLQL